ncbi:MAG: glycerate kinase family protein [Bacilli bacterium]
MNVLVASDSYKGSLSSADVIRAVQEAAARCGGVEVSGIPIADGGEGVIAAIVEPLNGRLISCEVTDPIGRKIPAHFALAGNTAIVEMAVSSGLTLLSKTERNPLYTTTFGLGELIREALDHPEVREIIVGIGGSATNDGGIGMAQALGLRALDANQEQIPFGGIHVGNIRKLDAGNLHPRLKDVTIRVMCDVSNPLCGANGASAVYGPQKGASPEMVEILDHHLRHLAVRIRADLGVDVLDVPGAGAAGGVGAALIAFCDAQLETGIDVILDLFDFEEKVQNADLVLTGEGKTDSQTAYGKAVAGVAKRAQARGKPVVCLSGALGEGLNFLYEGGVDGFFSICSGPMSEEYAMQNAYSLAVNAAENILRLYRRGSV